MLGWDGMASRTLAHPTPHPMGALSADNGCERTLSGLYINIIFIYTQGCGQSGRFGHD